MRKKFIKYIKLLISVVLIFSLVAPSYASLSASDGSAFVTKAEFDSALADFNSRLTTFEAGINSKIDSQVTSYLDRNGIWSAKVVPFDPDPVLGWSKTNDLGDETLKTGLAHLNITVGKDCAWGEFINRSIALINTAGYNSVTQSNIGQTRISSGLPKSGLMHIRLRITSYDRAACQWYWPINTSPNSFHANASAIFNFSQFFVFSNTDDFENSEITRWQVSGPSLLTQINDAIGSTPNQLVTGWAMPQTTSDIYCFVRKNDQFYITRVISLIYSSSTQRTGLQGKGVLADCGNTTLSTDLWLHFEIY